MSTLIKAFFTGAALLVAGWSAVASDVGQAAPACDLAEFGGSQPFDMRQFRGQVVYVDFWASWCASCAKSFPFMNALDREFRDGGLRIVGINLDEDIDGARAFLGKRPASFTLASDVTGQCPHDFGVIAMPSSYLVDRQGTIRHVFVGFRPGEAGDIREKVQELLAEPAAAGPGTQSP